MAQGAGRRAGEVRLVGLTHHHPGAAEAAISDVSLTIPAGESVALLGREGAGKTTLLRLVAGLDRPTHGHVLLDEDEVSELPTGRRPVAAIFGRYSLYPFLDVAANVAFGLRSAPDAGSRGAMATAPGRAGMSRRVREALELVRLGDYARRRPAQLSPVHQQRVAIARALVLRPRALVLDEPLAALDDEDLCVRLAEDLRALRAQLGITMIYGTRSAAEASAVADRVVVLEGGRLLLQAEPATDAGRPAVVDDAEAAAGAGGELGTENADNPLLSPSAPGGAVPAA
ncbi:MAG: ATP-binding cassette domain-containing protein [Frankia sp.]|nr:ATP-binding cassette domain-containing protein [Frankia sp.]